MPFPGLIVQATAPAKAGLSARADVALFVGLVARRPGPLPAEIRAELTVAGWAGAGPLARPETALEALLDVPVAVESWDRFDTLFAWDARPLDTPATRHLPCPLGLAVRSFFNEGGRRAYILRVGDPSPLDDAAGGRPTALRALLPGLGDPGAMPDPGDPRGWRGAALAWALDDAAMLCLPDLPELFALPPMPVLPVPPRPVLEERFQPCAIPAPDVGLAERVAPPALSAPRLDRAGFVGWAGAVAYALDLLNRPRGRGFRRDVLLLASLPLPSHADDGLAAMETWPLAMLDEPGLPAAGTRLFDPGWLGSARLQLAYPWVRTALSAGLPEGVEGGEGTMAGAIARTALADGAFRSAAGVRLAGVRGTLPELSAAALRRGLPDGRADWLGDRLSLVGTRLGEPVLLSDATASPDRSWRAGGVSRLMGVLLRAARVLGQERVFEPAGPDLWRALRGEMEAFLEELRLAGALAGEGPADAYAVRCDETTMSPADIALGRVVVSVAFTAAQPIERIVVSLALDDAGGLALREAA